MALLDAIPYPVFYKDRDGRFLGCNRAFESCRNLTREELIGKTVFDLLPPEEARRHGPQGPGAAALGRQRDFPGRADRPGGHRQILVTKATFGPADGRPGRDRSPRSWT